MGDVASEGRTVLFVSHNMQAVMSLCPRSILLDKGMVVTDSPTEQSLRIYRQNQRKIEVGEKTAIGNDARRRGGGGVRITSASTQDVNGEEKFNFGMGDSVRFKLSYRVFSELQGLVVTIALRSGITREIVTSVRHVISSDTVRAGTSGTVVIELPNINIRPGEYPLYLHLCEHRRKKKSNMDVVDDLTAPLVIVIGEHEDKDFDPLTPVGYFSIPSVLLSEELDEI
jgi:lipopolysaccharide transport system ATP-binding protein